MKKRKLKMPTAAEDAAINAGIAADPDTHEATAEDFAKAVPASGKMLALHRRGRGKQKGTNQGGYQYAN